jgi:hypothetical protein
VRQRSVLIAESRDFAAQRKQDPAKGIGRVL